jgi:rfaE bifunctional protein kinase chain/domain
VKLERLEQLLKRITGTNIIVAGDFFLDQYWLVDPSLAEISLETGLAAHQIVDLRLNPGAAGTVANNLAALGVGRIEALGVLGDDGSGKELIRGLCERGIHTDNLIVAPGRRTPVYTKRIDQDTQREMERFDIKNRIRLRPELEDLFLEQLRRSLETADGAAILDQVQEPDCGVITSNVRQELSKLARQYEKKVFLADSRTRILEFRNVLIKPNLREASEALSISASDTESLMRSLSEISRGSVYLTRGADGILLFDGRKTYHFPALPVSGPIDIVGAGDSVSAAIVSSICAGASLAEAGQMANLVASITIQKLGTTGTATPREVLETAESQRELIESW